MIHKFITYACLAILFYFTACTPNAAESSLHAVQPDTLNSAFTSYMEFYFNSVPDSVSLDICNYELETSNLVRRFYTLTAYQPVWTTDFLPNKNSGDLLLLVENVQNYGLDSTNYYLTNLRSLCDTLFNHPGYEKLMDMTLKYELMCTNSCLLLMSHLKFGVLEPDSVIYGTPRDRYPLTLLRDLEMSLHSKDFKTSLLNIQPSFPAYKKLQSGLEKYLSTYPFVDTLITIPHYKTDSTNCYNTVKEWFTWWGYLKTDSVSQNDTSCFFNALRKFQKYHGLQPDGKIGKYTYKALHKNPYEKYNQIVINLERLRWENAFPEKYIFVNIPSYTLKIVENDSVVKIHKVVVGRTYTPTPQLTSEIRYFNTYPYWYVPRSISTKEMLGKIKKDSTYLKRNNYKLLDMNRNIVDAESVNWQEVTSGNFSYRVRQGAGRSNSLGTLKFIFPNKYDVYLHDTPSKSLFNKDIRAYSHGCMRLHNPKDFAAYLLKYDNQEIDSIGLDSIMKKRQRKYIKLQTPLPVYVRYITCEADENNDIYFYTDIYSKDQALGKDLLTREVAMIR